jgi:hypothetical protein
MALAALTPVYPVLRAIACAVVPEALRLDEQGWARFEGLVEGALAGRPATLTRRLRLALYAVEWLPVFRYRRRFTALAAAERQRFLSFLENNSLQTVRVGFFGLRTLAFVGYYGQPEVAKEIGYAADARGWEAPR